MSSPESVDVHTGTVGESMRSVVEALRESATVRSVYGDPVEFDGRTVVPVASVAFGFGGGYGEGEETESESAGSGGGVGGGAVARPLGVVEVSDAGTRFVRFTDRRRLGAAALFGAAVGYLLGRR